MVFMPRPCPKEFREGAVQLARQGERPIAEIARERGIAESCLRNWLKRDQLDRREDASGGGCRATGVVRAGYEDPGMAQNFIACDGGRCC